MMLVIFGAIFSCRQRDDMFLLLLQSWRLLIRKLGCGIELLCRVRMMVRLIFLKLDIIIANVNLWRMG